LTLGTATLAVLAAAPLATAPLGAQQNLGRDETSWRWDGTVGSGQWFRLYNVNGPVHVTASSDNAVHVRAEKHVRTGGDPRAVHFDVVQGNGVTVCALWNDEATCDERGPRNNSIHTGSWDRRQNVEVAFEIQVPSGVRASMNTVNGELEVARVNSEVMARTVNGAVQVTEVGASVVARTVNGDVSVDTRGGPVSAETVNGSITASMAAQGSADMRFKTVNGTIDIDAPQSLNASVELSTVNGGVESKFPLNYDRRRRHAEGTVGKGGPTLMASTVNGSVTLK
jgi:hypothetical protein